MKRKNGFTLIELLAVIVILAIIAIIATPIVLNIIKDARESSVKQSLNNIISGALFHYSKEQMAGKEIGVKTIDLKDEDNGLEIKGNIPSGSITVFPDGSTLLNSKFENGDTYIKLPNETIFDKNDKSIGSYLEWETNGNGVITKYIVNTEQPSHEKEYFIIPNRVKHEDGSFEKITTIGEKILMNKTFKNIVISEGIEYIESQAFANSKFENIFFANSIKSIGLSAFYSTTIQHLNLPTNLELLGPGAFRRANLEAELFIPKNVKFVDHHAFADNNITKIIFEEECQLETIGESAFTYNKLLGKLIIPNCVKEIKNNAFSYNTIDELVFEKNSKLEVIDGFHSSGLSKKIVIPKTVKIIENEAFANNNIGQVEIEEASDLEEIGSSAFRDAGLTGEIIIPNSVKQISRSAFSNNSIEKITFEANSKIEKIEARAFEKNNIKKLVIPANIKYIDGAIVYENPIESLIIQRLPGDDLYVASDAFVNVTPEYIPE